MQVAWSLTVFVNPAERQGQICAAFFLAVLNRIKNSRDSECENYKD
jgi:hypothetical protein